MYANGGHTGNCLSQVVKPEDVDDWQAENGYLWQTGDMYAIDNHAGGCERLTSRDGVYDWPAGGCIRPAVKPNDVDDWHAEKVCTTYCHVGRCTRLAVKQDSVCVWRTSLKM